jgi:hypothetical protein
MHPGPQNQSAVLRSGHPPANYFEDFAYTFNDRRTPMDASTAKIIGIVLIVLVGIGFMKACVVAPLGLAACSTHGIHTHWIDRDGWWFWPVAGFGGFLTVLYFAVIVWVLFWVHKDAQSRGMNGVLWVLLVFFLHFIGLVIYLLVRSGYPVQKPTTPAVPPATPPPQPTAPPIAPSAAPPAPPVPSAPAACAKCGHSVQPGWVACPHCGERL